MSARKHSLAALLDDFPALAAALPGIQQAAASTAPVLILGEPGSGRSLLARLLHAASPRSAGPLVEVDPAALPSSLFEAEIFGYRAGAFTGADENRPGRLDLAGGGTLVLDHVEEIPAAAQPKLLRVLAEGRYAPLGGREREADVRFLALAGDDLPQRVERGTFRQDLFYRLEVLAFHLPPLRKRRADLEPLVAHLLADLQERFATGPLELSPAAREWMLAYRWPGNLRELRNVLERALILARGGLLDPPPAQGLERRPAALSVVEGEQIRLALAYTRGHQGRAAELLGISRKALWQKRRRHGIP